MAYSYVDYDLQRLSFEVLNHLWPDLVWWYIIISQSVLWKKLDCWVQGQGHSKASKCQWLFVWTVSSELINLLLPTWYGDASSWVDMSCEKLIHCRQVQGHSEGSWYLNINFYYSIWTADPFTTRLGLMAHHHELDCLDKRFDCCVVFKVKVTARVQNWISCSSGWFLLNCWTFCNQTW